MPRLRPFITCLAVAILIFAQASQGHADDIFTFTLDTTPISGTNGFLDLQFNPGADDALLANVTLSQVFTDSLTTFHPTDPNTTTTGGETGTLPQNVTLTNSGALNELFESTTFGTNIQFTATISGPALNPTLPLPSAGSLLAVAIYDADQTTPLLTTSADGSLADVNINPDGTVSTTTYPDNTG